LSYGRPTHGVRATIGKRTGCALSTGNPRHTPRPGHRAPGAGRPAGHAVHRTARHGSRAARRTAGGRERGNCLRGAPTRSPEVPWVDSMHPLATRPTRALWTPGRPTATSGPWRRKGTTGS